MDQDFRKQFPALSRLHEGKPLIFLDGPAGTQVPNQVIDAISGYYRTSNANLHGAFITTQETDNMLDQTRQAVSHFLGAEGPHTISFGQNMTTLTYSLSKAIARSLQPGDEILITQLDHEANRGPWLALRENGIIVKEVRLKPTGVLDYEDMEAKINERTRLVAIGYASNIFGTINDIALARKLTDAVGAWLLIDAVHFAPHFPLDVQALRCDFLLSSAYKFYGPHVGLLYSRPGLLNRLQPDRLRTAPQYAPHSIETGTLNHAALAGVKAAIDFIANQGKGKNYREKVLRAMNRIHKHEIKVATRLYEGLLEVNGISIVGPPIHTPMRAPTLALVIEGKKPVEVCQLLATQNICAWAGHFYAIRATEITELWQKGGVTRMGISAYTSLEAVEQTIKVIKELV